jgi:hypothetical protein
MVENAVDAVQNIKNCMSQLKTTRQRKAHGEQMNVSMPR